MPRLDRYPTKPHFDRYARPRLDRYGAPRVPMTPAMRKALDDLQRPMVAAWTRNAPAPAPLIETLAPDDPAVLAWRARGGR